MFLWDPRKVLGFGKRAFAKACRRETVVTGTVIANANAVFGSNGCIINSDGNYDHIMADVEELQISQNNNVQPYGIIPSASHVGSFTIPGVQQNINALSSNIQQSLFHGQSGFPPTFGQQQSLPCYGQSQASFAGHINENVYIQSQALPFGSMAANMPWLMEDNLSSMEVDDGIKITPSNILNAGKPKRRVSADSNEKKEEWNAQTAPLSGRTNGKDCVSICRLDPPEANAAKVAAWKRISAGLNINLPDNPGFDEHAGGQKLRSVDAFGKDDVCGMWDSGYQTFTGDMPHFGTELSTLTKSYGVFWGSSKIPAICKHILDYLIDHHAFEKEGLFRLAGAEFRSKAILRDINAGIYNDGFASLDAKPIDKGGCVASAGKPNMNPPTLEMACLLKQFLRDLPDPLIPSYLNPIGRLIVERHNPARNDLTVALLRDMIILLPDANRDLLAFLLDVGNWTVKWSHMNLMGSENLARVIGPNLIKIDPFAGLAAGSNTRGRSAVCAAGLDAFDWVIQWFKLCLDNANKRTYNMGANTKDCWSEESALFTIEGIEEGEQKNANLETAHHWPSLWAHDTLPHKKVRFQQKWKKAWKRGNQL